jgi:hypothetical protein
MDDDDDATTRIITMRRRCIYMAINIYLLPLVCLHWFFNKVRGGIKKKTR